MIYPPGLRVASLRGLTQAPHFRALLSFSLPFCCRFFSTVPIARQSSTLGPPGSGFLAASPAPFPPLFGKWSLERACLVSPPPALFFCLMWALIPVVGFALPPSEIAFPSGVTLHVETGGLITECPLFFFFRCLFCSRSLASFRAAAFFGARDHLFGFSPFQADPHFVSSSWWYLRYITPAERASSNRPLFVLKVPFLVQVTSGWAVLRRGPKDAPPAWCYRHDWSSVLPPFSFLSEDVYQGGLTPWARSPLFAFAQFPFPPGSGLATPMLLSPPIVDFTWLFTSSVIVFCQPGSSLPIPTSALTLPSFN